MRSREEEHTSRILVRTAGARDAAAMAAVSKQEPDSWSEADFEGTLKTDTARIWAAEEDGAVCAYAVVYYDSDGAELVQIAVDRNRRRRGIASRLLRAVFLFLREYRVPQIILEVRAGNAAGRAFYTECGFEEIFVQKDFYRNPPDDAVRMIRQITEN